MCGAGGYNGNTGAATSVKLNSPTAVAVDTIGNVYIADKNNYCVRKLTTASNTISSVVGVCGTVGSFSGGGVGTSTTLPGAQGVAVDGSGNVYISDGSSTYVVKWSASTGNVAYVPGSGNRYGSNEPIGVISLDGANNIYFGYRYYDSINVLRVVISSSPSALTTPSTSPSASQTPTATVTPYCAPSLYRALPRMDLVGTLVGSAIFPGQGFYTNSEAACRQACCDAAVCDSFSFAAGSAAFYPVVAWTTATLTATASPSLSFVNFGGSPAPEAAAAAAAAAGSSVAFGAQCFLYTNVTALAPSSLVSSGVLVSNYS
jgi:hypothetical protein